MLSVIIADDEIWICRLIQKLIDWNTLGLTLVQECYDGLSAFNSIKELSADIVITDIRMPGLDGIELIKNTREAGLDTEFIIISGYRDFEYAQKALQYNVYDYILKPINEDLLTEALCELKETILRNRSHKAHEVELREKANQYEQIILEQTLLNCLDGTTPEDESIYNELGLASDSGLFSVLVLKLMPLSPLSDTNDRNAVAKASIKRSISKCLDPGYIRNFYVEKDDQMIFILHYNQSWNEKIRQLPQKVQAILIDDDTILEYYCFSAGLGSSVNALEEIGLSYKHADEAWRAFLHLGINKFYDYSSIKFQAVDINDRFDFECRRELSGIWIRNDEAALTKFVQNLFIPIQNSSITPQAHYQTSEVLISFITEKFLSQLAEEDSPWDFDELSILLQRCTGQNQIVSFLISNLLDAMENWHEHIGSKQSSYITSAIEYIQQNYMNNITLKEVASYVFLNPTYFSEVFKKEMGINFKKYLIEYRVQLAAELLKNNHYKITDVAQMVGYKDNRYFSRLFFKVMGVSAQQYRKTYE